MPIQVQTQEAMKGSLCDLIPAIIKLKFGGKAMFLVFLSESKMLELSWGKIQQEKR